MQPDDDKTRTYVPLTNGTMVSQYRIIEKIGAGGMGEVYLAQDTKLDRKVALKFLPLHLCQDLECRERFTREAQAAARLDHPNIVSVFEVGEFQGRPFFSMQHVEGQSLKEVLSGKALPLDRILEIGIQVCDGLQAAHDKGIIHRDIKPSNILIDSHGRARIVDFGLASVMGSDRLTKTGSTMGTVGYMSPEQVRGDKIDHRSDLFSLGVVLYEMITGHAPFKADSEAATWHAITNTKPELLARFRREVPVELQTVIDKALDNNLVTRYQHADELAADLKRLSSVVGRQQMPRRNLWNRYVVTSSVTVILVIAGYWVVKRLLPADRQEPESIRKMLAVLPFENLGSPDDEYFADGMTDAVTTDLAKISDLGVISRSSTMLYKGTKKRLREIAGDLGVAYLLTGTILWDKSDSPTRIRVNTNLIRVADDRLLWSDSYEHVLEKVFALQEEIANDVTQSLQVVVSSGVGQKTVLPTTDLAAYDYVLRGNEYFNRSWESHDIQAAAALYEKAVSRDSTYAQAWAMLSRAYESMYFEYFDRSESRRVKARQAVERALLLQPELPEGHLALGYVLYHCYGDYDGAIKEFTLALACQPNNSDLFVAIAAVQRRRGELDKAAENFSKALDLTPRSHLNAFDVGLTLGMMRKYALAESYLDRAILLAPDWPLGYVYKAWLPVFRDGNVHEAKRIIDQASQKVDLKRSKYYWWLRRIIEPDPSTLLYEIALGTDTAAYYLQMAQVYRLTGRESLEEAYADSARVLLEPQVDKRPDDPRLHSYLGLAYAGLGRMKESLIHGQKALELLPSSRDAFDAPFLLVNFIESLVIFKEYDEAVVQLGQLLRIPGLASVPYLKLDPLWIPLRENPEFQRLLHANS